MKPFEDDEPRSKGSDIATVILKPEETVGAEQLEILMGCHSKRSQIAAPLAVTPHMGHVHGLALRINRIGPGCDL